MADQNFCGGLEVTHVEADYPWASMFDAQVKLRERLGVMPTDFSDLKTIAHKCIYWGHCINDEIFELLDWFGPDKSEHDPEWAQEIHMEAIDILHFVMNIGMEVGLNKDFFVAMEDGFVYEPKIDKLNKRFLFVVELYANKLRRSLVDIVGAMPWKNWRTYAHTDFNTFNESIMPYYGSLMYNCIELCQAVGLDRQGIINIYMAKNRENHRRQDDGYGD